MFYLHEILQYGKWVKIRSVTSRLLGKSELSRVFYRHTESNIEIRLKLTLSMWVGNM